MVAPWHFSLKEVEAISKAFFCAEEPSAFSVPVAHSAPAPEAAEEDAPEEAPAEEAPAQPSRHGQQQPEGPGARDGPGREERRDHSRTTDDLAQRRGRLRRAFHGRRDQLGDALRVRPHVQGEHEGDERQHAGGLRDRVEPRVDRTPLGVPSRNRRPHRSKATK